MEKETKQQVIVISAPRFETKAFRIRGTAPYVQGRFTDKAKEQIEDKMTSDQQGKKVKRKKRDFAEDFVAAGHVSRDGWYGIPAAAFRNAMIDACRLVGFKMTQAKMSVFIRADGFDKADNMPLVRLNGTPEHLQMPMFNANGNPDIRVRVIFQEWEAIVKIRWDLDQFSLEDIGNLLNRVGAQVGIGHGRYYSKQSSGVGWGTFEIVNT